MIKEKIYKLDIHRYKSLIRYVVVGVINTGVDFLTFSLLQGFFGVHFAISQVAGYGAGILNSFLMNKFWTFENKQVNKKTSAQAVKFVIVNLVTLGISIYGIKFLSEGAGLNIYIAKGLVTFLTLVINYMGYKLWVFREQ